MGNVIVRAKECLEKAEKCRPITKSPKMVGLIGGVKDLHEIILLILPSDHYDIHFETDALIATLLFGQHASTFPEEIEENTHYSLLLSLIEDDLVQTV